MELTEIMPFSLRYKNAAVVVEENETIRSN